MPRYVQQNRRLNYSLYKLVWRHSGFPAKRHHKAVIGEEKPDKQDLRQEENYWAGGCQVSEIPFHIEYVQKRRIMN